MNSNVLYIIDPGHGGEIDGVYQTAGKRSPKFDDGSVFYEGVNNRIVANMVIEELEKRGIDAIDIVNSNKDVSLGERVRRANELGRELKCLYISIHSDAFGNGKDWTSPSGISVYTSPGKTRSDDFAEHLISELHCNFESTVKWRHDSSDGDRDKEAHFYVLKKTSMPACLIEAGFHTNKEQCLRMMTKEWKDKLVSSIVGACEAWEIINE